MMPPRYQDRNYLPMTRTALISYSLLSQFAEGFSILNNLPLSPKIRNFSHNVLLSSHHRLGNKDKKYQRSPCLNLSEVSDLEAPQNSTTGNKGFDKTLALWCAGLAFDAYAEPSDSSRWEKGSKGLNVAFLSNAYTRNLYTGLVEVTPIKCTDLPNEDDAAESVLSGGGVDAYLLVAVVEGKMVEDIKSVEKDQYSSGVVGLMSSAHVGRSSTAWSNVNDEFQAKMEAKKKNESNYAYSIPSTWAKGGQAIWKDKPFYLYLSDPGNARLVFSVMDEDLVGEDGVIGSVSKKLNSLIPNVNNAWESAKASLLKSIKAGALEEVSADDLVRNRKLAESVVLSWEGDLKLQTKPRKEDKGGQMTAGAVAGAMIAGPVGAAAGSFLGSMYEEPARGRLTARIRYIPIPKVNLDRERYKVRGGIEGVDWGDLYFKHVQKLRAQRPETDPDVAGDDLEFCVYVNNEQTECSCGIYRSLEKRLIAISFRGTTVPKDMLTDANIIQSAWVEGTETPKKSENIPMVHNGFRGSLNSISRRLKELVLAAVEPGEDLSMYDVVVTGHSLGGALATLFTADVAQYGFDAGRGLPQLEASDPWWERLAANMNVSKATIGQNKAPPRPKSIRLYSFGSPRVGNDEFVKLFDSLRGNGYEEAYRVVNDADVVARLPRTVNTLVFGSVGYDHCGPTALISVPKEAKTGEVVAELDPASLLWVEGESDDNMCPVRDGATPLTSPLASGALLGDIYESVKQVTATASSNEGSLDWNAMVEKVGGRLQSLSASDITSVVGIDKAYADREVKIIQSVASGEALAHHLEDEYYQGMGRACGFIARLGEDVLEA